MSSQKLSRPKSMTVHDMYLVSTKQDNNFGIEGYRPSMKYADPIKMVQDKKYAEYRKNNKFPKTTIKPTKKGHYLNDLLALKKGFPGPEKYSINPKWTDPKDIEKGKNRPKNTTKNSYIDNIVSEQKKHNLPGVGKYNVIKTLDQIKKEVDIMKTKKPKGSERGTTVESAMYQATQTPGPGQYHPHLDVPKLRVNRTQPKEWIKKHQEESKKKPSQGPGPGQYKDCHPVNYETFGKLASKGGEKRSNVNFMGKTERFPDPKRSKSMASKINPGPNQYNMTAKWLGKEEGQKGNKKNTHNWMNRISRGISKSIYY